MPTFPVKVRQETTIKRSAREDQREQTMASIKELEAMYAQGDIEAHAYFVKKRSLIRLL